MSDSTRSGADSAQNEGKSWTESASDTASGVAKSASDTANQAGEYLESLSSHHVRVR